MVCSRCTEIGELNMELMSLEDEREDLIKYRDNYGLVLTNQEMEHIHESLLECLSMRCLCDVLNDDLCAVCSPL